MKKTINVPLVRVLGLIAMVAIITFAMTACGGGEDPPGHTHTYGTAWAFNDTQHWHECTANDGAKSGTTNHTLVGGSCTVCGYTEGGHSHTYGTAWVFNDTQHWHECTANDGAKSGTTNHTLVGGSCTVCDYTEGGQSGQPFLVELTPSSITFPFAAQGYSTQAVVAVTVKNTGTEWTTNLTVTFADEDGLPSGDFVGPPSVASIAPGVSSSFNIRPADGLSGGLHTATVSVHNSGGDIHESITVSFLVTPVNPTISELAAFLSTAPANTAATPYPIKMNINDLGGSRSESGSLGNALYTNSTKFVSLDMSGSSLTTIDQAAFSSCSSLTSVTIPASVTSIGNYAFSDTGLTSIDIPSTVTSLPNAFQSCSNLTSITIRATNPPTIDASSGLGSFMSNAFTIYVPAGSVDTYKTATNWTRYADKIQAIQ